ncbi:hypothetical protein M2454_002403 [Aequitasia blattaphilus]|uniref:GHKL domain-containing protein n=1 Tax=Aequitasia blattaphilus TaxID=2949332 RepID=A0ABT1ED58_9FIRM|nr:sensor histidine kinase [Aequitasia blattaphilus]MCP1102786.1 GHKL domain-containing protein [Aequitasia blattaphilus]MCR8615426.1 GHKL domain-containing protein [Aequitasia blattaphilus]
MDVQELMNTPRLYTAIAEWAACVVYILMLRRRYQGVKGALALLLPLPIFICYHQIAGKLPLYTWIPCMIGAIALMLGFLFLNCNLWLNDIAYCGIRAFVLAEFTASIYWQLYVWWLLYTKSTMKTWQIVFMFLAYLVIFSVYYLMEKNHITNEGILGANGRELFASGVTALGVFVMSNLSFIMPDTPFSSATSSILYIRTLVDFGGLVMLYSQQERREESRLKNENDSMNTVLQRQYDQYRIALENTEILRREFHDLKHYIAAISAETDAEKRNLYLEEMREAIATQEAFINTGNRVLDVVLTTKSMYCAQKGIVFQCMTDGKLLDFMHVKDICSIFGNAIDNAIESVSQIEDKEKHIVSLKVSRQRQFLLIQCENSTEKPIQLGNELPETTKKEGAMHGYGLKSIKASAEKYGGAMTLNADKDWFTLRILIPLRQIK